MIELERCDCMGKEDEAYLVADDVCVAEGRRLNEAVVLVHCVPARGVLLVVNPLRGGSLDGLAVSGDALNVTVGGNGGHDSESCEDRSSAGGSHLDRHCDVVEDGKD